MKQPSAAGDQPGSPAWIPNGPSPADNPHMTDDFARVYELTGNRITAPVAMDTPTDLPGTRFPDRAPGQRAARNFPAQIP